MANKQKRASKAEVQSTELNKLPVPGRDDTEFSAEDAAQAFRNQPNGGGSAGNRQ
ncbi:hypothetical protein [Paenibacillus sp.]|uniref:hypothetical protein n=1 Tax=Paenibacillus sp. TaxID=58172 RepID=UPI002D321986|nr:hypothetical protein [Paenibacillus sp.]HZG55702.1 hypothetical protein [Paenibacillus sp.]